MENVENKVILITGASSGIGRETARVLAQNGARVVLSARREDRLKALQAGMNEHLSKPIDPDALYRLLVKYLTERS